MIEKRIENAHFDDDFVPADVFRDDLLLTEDHPCYKCPFFAADDDTLLVWCIVQTDKNDWTCPIRDAFYKHQKKKTENSQNKTSDS